jgi:transcriptional regulator GlxA family with amidase domain
MSHRLDQAFEQALAYLDQHLHEPFDLGMLADIADIPQSHFEALFYALYHISIDAYVELLKSLEAAHLLGFAKQVSLTTIAAKLAYRNEQHFIESLLAVLVKALNHSNKRMIGAIFLLNNNRLNRFKQMLVSKRSNLTPLILYRLIRKH